MNKSTNCVLEMEQALQIIKEDLHKFTVKGNKAAGTRARIAMQEIKKLAQETRLAILEEQKK